MRFLGAMAGMALLGAWAFLLWGEAAWFADPERTGSLAEFLSLGEIAAQVRVPVGQVMAMTIPFLLLLRFKKCVWGASIATAYCLHPLFALNFGSPLGHSPSDTYGLSYATVSPPVTYMAANVLVSNKRKDEVFAMIRSEDPDVVGLSEVNKAWRDAAIESLGDIYPYHGSGSNVGEWTDRACGGMLLSKYHIDSVYSPELVIDGARLRPFVEVAMGGSTVTLLHTERPGRAWRLRARLSLLEQVADRDVSGPRVVMGDFNTTTSSPLLKRFLSATGLLDSRMGFGRQPTWNHFPGQVPVAISNSLSKVWKPGFAIDHVFVSEELSVLERRTVPIPGSDHLAVLVTLKF